MAVSLNNRDVYEEEFEKACLKQSAEFYRVSCLVRYIKKSTSNFQYTRGITPKRLAGPISTAQRLGNTAPKKRCSRGEPLHCVMI